MTESWFVGEMWRYPVKSMMGEQVQSAEVTERGFAGDRAYALVDLETGKVASAKNPRKWGSMFEYRALFAEAIEAGKQAPPVKITLPNGSVVESSNSTAAEILSNALGRKVAIIAEAPPSAKLEEYWPDLEGLSHRDTVTDERVAPAAPAGTFFDCAAIHLVTSATLARLAEVYPAGRFEARRFRPNLVVETPGLEGFVENDWVGRQLLIGDVRLNVIIPSPRCVMTTLAQGDLPADAGVLRAAAQHNRVMIQPVGVEMPSVGVYAVVEQGGSIRKGDEVLLA
jgi:uncharacterized protein